MPGQKTCSGFAFGEVCFLGIPGSRPTLAEPILFGQAEFILLRGCRGHQTSQDIAIVPGIIHSDGFKQAVSAPIPGAEGQCRTVWLPRGIPIAASCQLLGWWLIPVLEDRQRTVLQRFEGRACARMRLRETARKLCWL